MDIKGYSFGEFYLDCRRNQLFKHKQKVELHDKSLLLLTLLIKASPHLVCKDELHNTIWPETIVSDWSLSRLVSDTRAALGESGDHNSIIKTERGKGFSIPNAIARYDPVEAIKSHCLLPYIVSVLVVCFALIATLIWQKAHQEAKVYHAISNIKTHQDNAFTAFIAQAKRRNELVEKIESRLNIKRSRQFELFFNHVAGQMNDEERFICQQMRIYSDAGIYKNNQAILSYLDAQPTIYKEIPLAHQLAQHLRVWISKYENLFIQNKDMCLVYVGVEDGVPYPSAVDQQIKDWLNSHNKLPPETD